MPEPLVTIGLQFYNAERTLALAVQSILNQTYTPWELLLQDDGSTDGSLGVARSFGDSRIRVFSDGTNKTRPPRINEGLGLARGGYFALMDADDVAYPERIACQARFLDSHPEVDLVGAGMMVFDNEGNGLGKRQGPTQHGDICARPWAGFPLAQPTFMGRVDWFLRHGYRNGTGPVEDQDLLLRSYRQSSFANIPEILMGYREVAISFRRLVRGRRLLARSLARQFRCEGRPWLGMWAAAQQVAKGSVDAAAVVTGLGYRILRHRARLASPAELDRWEQVWRSTAAALGPAPVPAGPALDQRCMGLRVEIDPKR